MLATPLKIAIIDMYDGSPNVGMQCIDNILETWGNSIERPLEKTVFHLRDHCEVPDLSYDIYISTGGPGSPIDSINEAWDQQYVAWLDQAFLHKKWVFLICHSFQIACRHFNIGKISLRKSRQIGILPVHPLVNDIIFEGLKDPFYTLESRYYQITAPNDAVIETMGASIIILEKERPSVPLERAIMGVKFNSNMYGVQFHPEADPSLLDTYFTQPEVKNSMIESFGELKWKKTHHSIKDPQKVEATFNIMIPNFLNLAIGMK
ncbi:MAG: hypothetical protein RL387_1510 [Bacteroidota bacterium]|jgi:GMP synthase-like glutamine amidotransferase